MSDSTAPSGRLPWQWPLPLQIGLGIALGAGLGWLSGGDGTATGWDVDLYTLVGKLFMNGLSMLVVPLIAAALVVAVMQFGRMQGFARIGGKIVLYYLATGLIAILVGLALVGIVRPGEGGLSPAEVHSAAAASGSAEQKNLAEISAKTAGKSVGSFLDVVLDLVPRNIIAAAAAGQTLGVIVFALLFGVFAARLEGRPREVMAGFWDATYQIVLGMIGLVLRFLPIGVAALIAKVVAETVADGTVATRLVQLGKFTGVVIGGLAIHALVVIPLVLLVVARVDPRRLYRALSTALLTAFSTSSSNATMPLTLTALEGAGVSKRVTSVVVPVGANVNSDGTALYECVVVLFLAQFYGIHLGFAEQFLVVVYALATSIGVAGIPSASLVAIVVIINAVNQRLSGAQIPLEGLAVIMIVDRLLDMCRTTVNVLGDATCAVVVARSEGEGVLGAPPRGPATAAA